MSDRIVVTVKEGRVRGFKQRSLYSGIEYYSFLGVPYGQPTDGQARFKDPARVKPWSTTLDATVEKTGCIHYSIRRNGITGTEDCLYNNIHTPELPKSKDDSLKPVIVQIHPGGFFHGSPDPHYYGSPEYVMNRDIVYVSVGYRLHILGYLNLNLKECSGNQALKDIILSLRWIRENIANFGGDPENVTVLGSSSGSGLVHCLLLSQSAKGLYHKAVMMGMHTFNPVVASRENNIHVAYKIACRLGYEGKKEERRKMLHFFKKINMEPLIVLKLEHYFNTGILPIFPASPFMPTPDSGETQVLSTSIRSLIPSTNRIPIIVGFCEREAAMGLPFYQGMKRSDASKYFYNSLRQNEWGWAAHLSDEELDVIRQEIESFYLDGESIEGASQETTCDILTDASLSDLYESLIGVISEDLRSDVYVYKFKYDGELCVMKSAFQPMLERPLSGTFHAADYAHWSYIVEHVKGRNMNSITSEERQITDTFTNLIATFAKTGNPNFKGLQIQWRPTTPEHPTYLSIDTELEMKNGLLNGERTQFWQKLKKKFNHE